MNTNLMAILIIYTAFPQINMGYNPEDKLLVGFGFSAKTYGFRKEPYSTFQKLSTLYAFTVRPTR